MPIQLPPLPFAYDALEPHISARTLEFHHDKHHQAYVTALNNLVRATPLENATLEDIIRIAVKDEKLASIFNNAAQVWNHNFFWQCLKNNSGAPTGEIEKKITQSFGSYDAFREKFAQAGLTQFGSGYAWLIYDQGKLDVIKTPNGVNPLSLGYTALLTCDVWEHAYYLDYQNRRADFLQAFLLHLVNWDFVEKNLAAAIG